MSPGKAVRRSRSPSQKRLAGDTPPGLIVTGAREVPITSAIPVIPHARRSSSDPELADAPSPHVEKQMAELRQQQSQITSTPVARCCPDGVCCREKLLGRPE